MDKTNLKEILKQKFMLMSSKDFELAFQAINEAKADRFVISNTFQELTNTIIKLSEDEVK